MAHYESIEELLAKLDVLFDKTEVKGKDKRRYVDLLVDTYLKGWLAATRKEVVGNENLEQDLMAITNYCKKRFRIKEPIWDGTHGLLRDNDQLVGKDGWKGYKKKK